MSRVGAHRGRWMMVCLAALIVPWLPAGDSLATARDLYRHGDYAACARFVEDSKEGWHRELQLLRVQALMTTGPATVAADAAMDLPRRFFRSMEGHLLAYQAARQAGRAEIATALHQRLLEIAGQVRPEFWGAGDLVALGRAALIAGAEPRQVLEQFYKRAMKIDTRSVVAYLAAGELALSKNDYAVASQHFTKAAEIDAQDPDAWYGLARCAQTGDRVAMRRHLDAAFAINPHHPGCLLLQAEHEIDSESYVAAAKTLDRLAVVNATLPELWCLRAVLAHLTGDAAGQEAARAKALEPWPENPAVDHLIGRKLSDHYRFREGAEHQRRALALEPGTVPATIQLAQDLLRLGQEREGWRLAEEAANADGYLVVAHNLSVLRQHLDQMRLIETPHFRVRMDPREAAVYGDEVMTLLDESRRVLGAKYGIDLSGPVSVEIYPNQQDFAIRTFGVPGGAGYLGVCFGNVITMNSPGGLSGGAADWRSVLWHEFCHTVTLHLSANKMPRWLSEGISVHEELQRDPTWGQRMIPDYRRMILDGQAAQLGQLSATFLNPKSGQHLLFAYYQSALAVEFLLARHGQPALRAILVELAAGTPINAAIAKHTAPMEQLEPAFAAFVQARALDGIASPAVIAMPPAEVVRAGDEAALSAWVEANPGSAWGRQWLGDRAAAKGAWAEARGFYEKAIALDPGHIGADSAWGPLAIVLGHLGDREAQLKTWRTLADRSPTASEAFTALLADAEQRNDHAEIFRQAKRLLALNPMAAAARRSLARAADATGRSDEALAAWRTLLALTPPDAAEINYRIARLLAPSDRIAAKRHVLDALVDAPRYRDAHALLLELTAGTTP